MLAMLRLAVSTGCILFALHAARSESPYAPTPSYQPAVSAPPQQAPGPYRSPAVQPQPPRAMPPAVAAAPYVPGEKIDHLLQAARHLEAAGLTDEAAEIRRRIQVRRTQQQVEQQQQERAAKERLLAEKLAELQALSAEIDRLRGTRDDTQQVMLDIKLLKIHRGKCRALGIDFSFAGEPCTHDCIASGCQCDQGAACVCDVTAPKALTTRILSKHEREIREFIDLAGKHGLIQVVASPRIVATSGMPFSFSDGEGKPVRQKTDDGRFTVRYVRSGTSINAVPTILENGAIDFDMQAIVRQITGVDGQGDPCVVERNLNTRAELVPGETLVLRRVINEANTSACQATAGNTATDVGQCTEIVVLVTPTLISKTPPVPTAIPAPRPSRSAARPRYIPNDATRSE